MLNKAPNNNNVKCVANIVLNEAPTCNDAMRIGNNVRLTAVGAQQFSMVARKPSCRKADLPEMRDNDTITRNVRADGNKLRPGKNEGYIPSSLGSRLISVSRQAGSETKKLRFDNFNSANSKA